MPIPLSEVTPDRVAELHAEVDTLRQALWDVYGALGFDQDGDATPTGVQDLPGVVLRAAREFARDYDAALDQIPDDPKAD